MKILLALALLTSITCSAAQIIKIGAYDFAPYFNLNENRIIKKLEKTNGTIQEGLTVAAVNILNELQSDFIFKIVAIPAKRRYEMLKRQQIDILLFEDKAWGWKTENIDFFTLPLNDGEVYLADKKNHNDDSFFEKFAGKKVVGILGYHYACTQFVDNPEIKIKDFEFTAVSERELVIQRVLSRKSDIGILTRSYLQRILSQQKDLATQIYVGTKPDQKYNLGVVSSKSAPITQDQIKHLMGDLMRNKKFITLAKPLDLL